MNKKNVSIVLGVIVLAVVIVLLVLFNSKHEVEFNTNGGSSVETQEVKYLKSATRPADPTREGYAFDNWYFEDEVFDFDTKIKKDMKIEARWIEAGTEGTYTVKFNSNGGSDITDMVVKADGTVTKPSNPTREGYKFIGWQYNGEDWDFSKKITGNMTLVAVWEKEEEQPVADTTFKITNGNITLYVGNSKTLSTKNASGSVSWTSSDTSVATVSNGKVVAIKKGTTKITATNNGETSTITVTVKEVVAVSDIKLSATTLSLEAGKTQTIKATVSPSNATDKTVKWSSSDSKVAKVDSNGKVTAVAAGTCTITAKSADGKVVATLTVTVTAKQEEETPEPTVDLSKYTATCPVPTTDNPLGQCAIVIKDASGKEVSGKVKITNTAGKTKEAASGSIQQADLIAKIEVISID